jgi:hypothetical protein
MHRWCERWYVGDSHGGLFSRLAKKSTDVLIQTDQAEFERHIKMAREVEGHAK